MICKCMDCKVIYRIKEPFEDESETHGLCPDCFRIRIKEVRQKARGFRPGKLSVWKASSLEGASSVEYAIIVSLIAGVIVLAVSLVGESLKPLFELAANLLP